jgi:hypothetical protein
MAKSLTDPLTGKRYLSEAALEAGVERDGHAQLCRMGVTARQLLFNRRNGLPLGQATGRSVISGRPTEWNEKAGRYERFADDAERAQYRQSFLDRMNRTYGRDHILDDPERQRAMLAARSISGTYRFQDGTERTYTGSYERDFLEFMDLGLNWPGADVQTPAPQNIPYRGADGKMHIYIPDGYLESLDLLVECKSEENKGYRLRDIAVERAKDSVLGTSGYNFVKIFDRDYGPLVDEIARLKAA